VLVRFDHIASFIVNANHRITYTTLYKSAKMLRGVESPSKVAAAKSRSRQAPKSKESDAERPAILAQILAHRVLVKKSAGPK